MSDDTITIKAASSLAQWLALAPPLSFFGPMSPSSKGQASHLPVSGRPKPKRKFKGSKAAKRQSRKRS